MPMPTGGGSGMGSPRTGSRASRGPNALHSSRVENAGPDTFGFPLRPQLSCIQLQVTCIQLQNNTWEKRVTPPTDYCTVVNSVEFRCFSRRDYMNQEDEDRGKGLVAPLDKIPLDK